MVVVAADEVVGDPGYMSRVCNIKKGDESRPVPVTDNINDVDVDNCDPLRNPNGKNKYRPVLTVVGGKKYFFGSLCDTAIGAEVFLRIGSRTTVSDIKNVVTCYYPDHPAVDDFEISLCKNDNTHRLDSNCSITADQHDLNDQRWVIEVERSDRHDKSIIKSPDQSNHHSNDADDDDDNDDKCDIEMNNGTIILIHNLTTSNSTNEQQSHQQQQKLHFFFVTEKTLVSDLFNSLCSIEIYKSLTDETLVLQSGNIKMTMANGLLTLKEVGFDFTKFSKQSLIVELPVEDYPKSTLSSQSVYYNDNGCDESLTEKRIRWNTSGTHLKSTYGEMFNAPRDAVQYFRAFINDNNEDESTETRAQQSERLPPRLSVDNSESEPSKPDKIYVGLVNQAMTCYLNSLLQALYMTPEFRNALYNWEYIEGSEKDESNSIPYQLQKLFLNLQTSKKNAVETTALTKSFGWDSTEAWQQHDIQELCRVMLDSLEQKFKNTEQADLINRLYEGKMLDYVKCLECKNEKSREDTFLDIPLPVRPFGSNVAYSSVEEALRAFVQPETLDGVNQYFCETCNKKCNAHKGLKFTKFPYLLTLHLKRFDFDYNTFHRIKLNDKVTFPDILNLNSFITSTTNCNSESPVSEDESTTEIKCDENFITDNGNVDDGLPCDINGISSSEATNSSSEQNDDDGIDVSHCPSMSSTHSQENERNRTNSEYCIGPYQYELFSIMIHSGGAGGGHYYAYIKDFTTQEWLCFNDQNVSSITSDDIQKTYGGGPSRAYYNGAYSSSTNAYMLMYRQIDPERNALPMCIDDFPKHLQEVLMKIKEQDKKNQTKNVDIHRLRIFCRHPVEYKLVISKIFALSDDEFSTITVKAYKQFNLKGIVDLDQCRLVTYNPTTDFMICSFEGCENKVISEISHFNDLCQSKQIPMCDMMLEIKREDENFPVYLPEELITKVFLVNVAKRQIEKGPIIIRALPTITVLQYKKLIHEQLNCPPWPLHIVALWGTTEITLIDNDDDELNNTDILCGCKVFVANKLDMNTTKPFSESTLKQMIESFKDMVLIHIILPNTESEILEQLNISSLDSKLQDKDTDKMIINEKIQSNDEQTQKIDNNEIDSNNHAPGQKGDDSEQTTTSNNTPGGTEGDECHEKSNSEDSSLSDSDKTLVGDASEDDEVCLSDVAHEFFDFTTKEWGLNGMQERYTDKELTTNYCADYFFKVKCNKPDSPQKFIQVLVDKHMRLQSIQKHLESSIRVPAEYLKLERRSEYDDIYISSNLNNEMRLDDGEIIVVRLGRALRDDEFKVKLYYLIFNSGQTLPCQEFICDFIVSNEATVGRVKQDILAEFRLNYSILIPYDKCRLRKNNKVPSTVLLDDQKIKDVNLQSCPELNVQALSSKEIVTSANQTLVLTRLALPSAPNVEIALDTPTVNELKHKLVEMSDISLENLEVTKSCWLCNDIIALDDNWFPAADENWPLTIEDGLVILYRDRKAEDSKDDNSDDVSAIHERIFLPNRTSTRRSKLKPIRGRLTTISDYPRRERALKIYVNDE